MTEANTTVKPVEPGVPSIAKFYGFTRLDEHPLIKSTQDEKLLLDLIASNRS